MATFKGVVRLEDVIRFRQVFTPDGLVAEILFENLVVAVGGNSSSVVATRVASFTLPTSESITETSVQMTIRGYAETESGRAVLLAHLGDETVLAALPKSDHFQQVVEAKFPAGASIQTTLFLLAERDLDIEDRCALLVVDALDFKLNTQAD